MEELSEKQVIAGCRRNDRLSQEKLYKQFFPALFCLCKKFFQHDHEAMEALNDGMLKVFKKIDTYREGKGLFFNWVYTIVRHTALDKLKAAVPLSRLSDVLTGIEPDPGINPLASLESKDVYKLLDQLAPATRVVCSLFYLEGYAIKDIVGELGISPGTVKWHLSESRKKLKEIFEKHYNTST